MKTESQYEQSTYEARFVAAVREGLEQADAGQVLDHDEVGRRLDARFGKVRSFLPNPHDP